MGNPTMGTREQIGSADPTEAASQDQTGWIGCSNEMLETYTKGGSQENKGGEGTNRGKNVHQPII